MTDKFKGALGPMTRSGTDIRMILDGMVTSQLSEAMAGQLIESLWIPLTVLINRELTINLEIGLSVRSKP